MLRRGPLSLRTATHFRRRLASSSSSPATPPTAEKEDDGKSTGVFSSWVGKIKSTFQSKAPSPPPTTAPSTLIACADELKKLTCVANVANLLKFRRDVNQQSFIENLEKCSAVYRALGKHNPTGENVDVKQKALAAEECSCTIQDVDKALASFEWIKKLSAKMKQMHEKGEEIPKTVEEMSKLVMGMHAEHKLPHIKPPQSQSTEVSRNAPCTCGSGKKFKRCCGQSA